MKPASPTVAPILPLLLLSLLPLGCTTTSGGAPAAGVGSGTSSRLPAVEVPDLSERALLLMLVDRQMIEPLTVRRTREGGPELRRALAKIGTPVARVAEALEDLPDAERRARFLPHLFRFDEEDTVAPSTTRGPPTRPSPPRSTWAIAWARR